MTPPLCIDLFAGCFGWSAGWLELGGYVVGFDLEHLPHHGPVPAGADLVIQDVLTLHGSQFKDASLILASPPCQRYSWMAMPWTKAKDKARWYRDPEHPERIDALNALFNACFRIQREASKAAGHHIPMVVENVRGAQPWVGRARWMYGSFALFGDVPALMPMTTKRQVMKVGELNWRQHGQPGYRGNQLQDKAIENEALENPGFRFDGSGKSFQTESVDRATKNSGGSWFNIGSPGQKVTNQSPVHRQINQAWRDKHYDEAPKMQQNRPTMAEREQAPNPDAGTKGFAARLGDSVMSRRHGSKSSARKAASARIAKIPFPLASWIARTYYPTNAEAVA